MVACLRWFGFLKNTAAQLTIRCINGKVRSRWGESLARDAPQPMRAIFHVRGNKSEWLHKIIQGRNNQFAFSPESLLSIVGLDLVATCFSAESVVNPWHTTNLGDYMDVDVLSAKLRAFVQKSCSRPMTCLQIRGTRILKTIQCLLMRITNCSLTLPMR